MRKSVLPYLLLPLMACLTFTAHAAPPTAPVVIEQTAVQSSDLSPGAAQLDLNKADAAALQAHLSGIGRAKAEAIVAYREAHGPFASVDELLEIKGIGNALLERNRDKLAVQ